MGSREAAPLTKSVTASYSFQPGRQILIISVFMSLTLDRKAHLCGTTCCLGGKNILKVPTATRGLATLMTAPGAGVGEWTEDGCRKTRRRGAKITYQIGIQEPALFISGQDP